MKTFKNFVTLSEDITDSINDLCEASIHTSKYGYGHQAVLKTAKVDGFV